MALKKHSTLHAVHYCLLAGDYFSCAESLNSSRKSKTLSLKYNSVIEHNIGIGYELVFKAWLLANGKSASELKNIGHDLMNLREAIHIANFPINEVDMEAAWAGRPDVNSNPLFVGCLERLNARFGPASYRTRYPSSGLDPYYDLDFLIWAGKKFVAYAYPKCNAVFVP